MCYTIEFLERRMDKYDARYKEVLPTDHIEQIKTGELPLFYFVSGFSHPQLPIVKHDGIFFYEWGLIPFWIKDHFSSKDIQNKTLNAVGETVFEKPSFRKSIISKRCLIGINGFYEWREFNKQKYPYLIKTKSYEMFSLGCLYEHWVDISSGEIRNTFSIITTPANPLMERIHNVKKRMPLILKREDEGKWIDPHLKKEEIQKLIMPYDEADMTAYTISKKANSTANNRNVPEIIEKFEYPELNILAD